MQNIPISRGLRQTPLPLRDPAGLLGSTQSRAAPRREQPAPDPVEAATTHRSAAAAVQAAIMDGAPLAAAPIDEEGANLLALQTRQLLSAQSLSLASQADQPVLRMFEG